MCSAEPSHAEPVTNRRLVFRSGLEFLLGRARQPPTSTATV